MEHFTTQNWVDFVRQTADPAGMSEMKKHLDSSCEECTKSHSFWRLVMEQTEQLRRAEPPESALRAVKAGFKLRKVVEFPSGKLDLATLQFDSKTQPMAAGIRSGHAPARQLLYRSGTMCIDMRMQPKPGSESILLIGQLLDTINPGHGMGGIAVSLLSKGDPVLRKHTNPDGEFDFGLESSRDVQLVFGIDDTRTIVVAVPEGGNRVV
jgi:hypothetical protein